ncbi:Hsp20/alpha crystallin family protein [bacterium]|nr:Hsp20/alpha crystallin family protein [bacterium]
MTNALSFKNRDLFGFMPTFMSNWFDDFGMIPSNFTNSPKVNVKETDKAYEIEIANPGFGKDETTIKVEHGVLYVSMTSQSEEGENDGDKYHVKQWSKSSYEESWNLPENVIEDQISAKHTDGVLTITLPKKEEMPKQLESRTIEIE